MSINRFGVTGLNQYDLPVIDLGPIYGVVKVSVFSALTLTPPTIQTVKLSGLKKTETASINLSQQEVAQMTMEVRDDCSVHSAGFWFLALKSPCFIRMSIVEADSVERCFFYGIIRPQNIRWRTHYLDVTGTVLQGATGYAAGTMRIRTAQFTVLSMLYVVLNAAVDAWVTAVADNCLAIPGGIGSGYISHLMNVKGLFAAMMYAGGLNGSFIDSYSNTDVVFSSQDLKFYGVDTVMYHVGQLYVPVIWNDGGTARPVGYFDGTHADYLGKSDLLLQNLVSKILRNFALKTQLHYSMSTDQFSMRLVQPFRAFSTRLDFGNRAKGEDLTGASDLQADGVKVGFAGDSSLYVWSSRTRQADLVDNRTAVPGGMSFDVDESVLWHSTYGLAGNNREEGLYCCADDLHLGSNQLKQTEWWNYQTGAYVAAALPVDPFPVGTTMCMEEALCGYYARRAQHTQWPTITSKYKKIQAAESGVTSFTNIEILKETSIDDGTGARDHVANRVTMDLEKSETEIEWLQEEIA